MRALNKAAPAIKMLLAICAFVAIERFCHKQTKGFQLQKIYSRLTFNPNWATPGISGEESACYFDQPYYYLADGGQCYAFASQDGHFVLKFFKLHHLEPPSFLENASLFGPLEKKRQDYIQNQYKKLSETFSSCLIAYNEFKEETGLIYLHLNKTESLKKKITIYDRLNIAHEIDLDRMEFALQKKAELFLPSLLSCIQTNQENKAKDFIRSAVEFMALRCQKGIKDTDSGLKRNFGIVSGKVIEIDIGAFAKEESLKQKDRMREEIYQKTKRLSALLNERAPHLVPFFQESIEKACSTATF